MKRLPAILALFFIAVIGGWFLTSWGELRLDERRTEDGLLGPVQQVLVETAPLLSRFGDVVEGESSLESLTVYDEAGRVTWLDRYRRDNSLDYRIRYRYDNDLLLEETSFSGENEVLYHWVYSYSDGHLSTLEGFDEKGERDLVTTYRYDPSGRLVEQSAYRPDGTLSYLAERAYSAEGYTQTTAYYGPDGAPEYRTQGQFGTQGKPTEERTYGVDDQLLNRVSYRYSATGKLLEERAYGPDDRLEYRLDNRYDAQDRLATTREYDAYNDPLADYSYTYDARGNLTERMARQDGNVEAGVRHSYRYDEAGNWVERRTERLRDDFGETRFEPSALTRRTIRYF